MTGTPVFLFPGQSSRDPAMFARLEAVAPEAAREVLGRADAVLGMSPDPRDRGDDAFETNRDVQLAVFVATHGWLLALRSAGLEAEVSVGMSLGEYNHLVHAGAIDFDEALRLVDARGAAYDAGPTGAMAAVHPAHVDDVEDIVARVCAEMGGGAETLAVSNENSSTQQVVAGSTAAVERLCELAEVELYATATIIERRVPMHTARFAPVAPVFAPALARAPFRTPDRPYVPNVLGDVLERPSPEQITALLERHVHERVRLRASIERVVAIVRDPVLVEVGPRRVLHDLVRRDHPTVPRVHVDPVDAPPVPAEAWLTTVREKVLDAR